ncbi:MAG: sodium ion-translocating decarboxylase subunit beta [Spirochaetia bacterium]|nr:sodium ion-translocating decarboxylase subunit beta [Treponema sp.]MCI6317011.1 sodium ion-translocating decarboxylase subunit beta [Spirochaetia bacterium]MCI6365462.1 sodium ion-translocating decarboxylase subunit beta [Spirochaetia bacterium]MCI6545358.1 sodium ion-translocating decarboxylase subunit beta [Spirochaetia bacterium]MCI7437471.1 sodium ion-translocating decarboxylase subunit beta [Spirochaetia bacterium]
MLNTRTENNKKIALVMLAIMLSASVISLGSRAFAQDHAVAEQTGMNRVIAGTEDWNGKYDISASKFFQNIGKSTGIYKMIHKQTAEEIAAEKAAEEAKEAAVKNDPFAGKKAPGWQYVVMIAIGFLIVYLGAAKGFEPLLLIPIGFGTILVNIPGANMGMAPDGMLSIIYNAGVGNEFFPMLIFMGIGAMTDFGPLIANPKMAVLGGAAQLGVFFTLFGVALMNMIPGINYNILQAAAISIIGGADGPTSIYVSAKLAPELMAVIAVAAYSYMALVPMIQPPIMKALTTQKEREIRMDQLREVSKAEKVLFPLMLLVLTILLLPPACPLIGMLAFGNFVKQCGVVERLSKTMENELMNIVSILLSLGVGSQMTPEKIINPNSLGIILLGLVAFGVASAGGIMMAKLMNVFLPKGKKINPLIGSAGVSAVPMAARVSNKVGLEYDPSNFLLMNAMGPNVSGVIGTAIAAGVFIATFAK